MQSSPQRVLSPDRSRSIKLKVPKKMFPDDFFRRSSSQSPQKDNSKSRYKVQSPQKNLNP